MDNSSPQPTPPPPPSVPEPFKNWPECFKVLKKLSRPLQDADRDGIVARITASRQKRQIAFEILCLIQDPKVASKFRWLELPMLNVLGEGSEEPNLAAKPIPSEAKTWVYREFREVQTADDWKRFVESGKHLWVLHAILKAASNKQILIEALTALAESAEQCRTAPGNAKKKAPLPANSAGWIVKLIKARIPAKLDLPKTFFESLFAINATADLSEAVRKESNGLHFRLKKNEEELTSERQAKTAAEERAGHLQAKLDSALAETERQRRELEEERLHSTRQGGFNVVARNETINQVMAAVRKGAVHRLENIRAYADRENPDRAEIVALVGEIEKHLSRIEEVVRQ